MNRSRSVSETSVGLFAFLDVLMSTMGSLILVLMVVTPKIRQEAVARAAVAARHAVEARHAIESQDGQQVPADIRSLCVHGDTAGAVALARAVRAALEEAGVRVAAFA